MKRLINILLTIAVIFCVNVQALELPELYSSKVLLYDPESKEILYDKGGDEVSNIASLTKIMTTITAIEHIDDLDEMVSIGMDVLREIPYDASVAGLKNGDKVTMRDLLYASILPSGADATTALAHKIAGSTKEFVEMMNETATKLGLQNTHFANVTGYDIPNHYSTPREVLKILEYALENSLFEEIYKTRRYELTNGLVVHSTLNTYNRYMNLDLSDILGSKTGYTGDAGMCMSALFKTGGKEFILITLGAPYSYTTPYNLKDTVTVKKYLDDNYANEILFEKEREVTRIAVTGSLEEEYIVEVPNDIRDYVEKNYTEDDLRVEFDGVATLSYKNRPGERLGEVRYYYKDELVAQEDIFLEEELHFSFEKFVRSHTLEIGGTILLVVFVAIVRKNKKKKRRRRKMR